MQYILYSILQLGVLYWLANQLQRQLMQLFYRLLKTPHHVAWAMNLLFWPGVLVHELSHLLVGRLVLVKTRGLTIVPKLMPNNTVQMGSVQVPSTDRLRFFIIGVAPIFVGLGIIFGLLWLAEQQQLWGYWGWWLAVGYAIFQIANNMFLSSSDLRGALTLGIVIVLSVGLLRWMGVGLSAGWIEPWLAQHQAILAQVQRWLWVPIIIDTFILLLFGLSRWLLHSLSRHGV